MTTTEFFITLLSDFLNKRETVQPEESINWEELIKVAKLHEVTGIMYRQCKGIIPKEYGVSLDRSTAAALFYYANHVKEERIVLQRLRDAGVRCFIIKGSAVAEYYPVPAFRTMGDTDIVVDDAEKAHDVLIASGYTCKTRCAAYFKRDLLFELHDCLAYKKINSSELVAFFNGYWDYMKDGELDWNFHLLFLIFHLRGHFHGSGVGIRQFLDVAVVTKYCDTLDWTWIEQKLKELDLWTFAEKIFDLNRRWFGIAAPIPFKPVEGEFYKEATRELCTGGVFGSSSNSGRSIAAHGYDHPLLNMFKRAWGSVFVPYKNMIRMPQYEFLVGRPYLLPVAWIYRGWLTVKKQGMKGTARGIQASFVSREAVEEQKAYIEKWSR